MKNLIIAWNIFIPPSENKMAHVAKQPRPNRSDQLLTAFFTWFAYVNTNSERFLILQVVKKKFMINIYWSRFSLDTMNNQILCLCYAPHSSASAHNSDHIFYSMISSPNASNNCLIKWWISYISERIIKKKRGTETITKSFCFTAIQHETRFCVWYLCNQLILIWWREGKRLGGQFRVG